MHQIKLLSIGSLFLHFLHIYTIKYFDKKWNLLDHLMVISNKGGPTSDRSQRVIPCCHCCEQIRPPSPIGLEPRKLYFETKRNQTLI